MKTADSDLDSGCLELTGDVHGPRKLIALYADQRNQSEIAGLANRPYQFADFYARIGFIVSA